ncbi:MAG: MFS transporter [Actinobacteria bacterium]|nr:MFS transporter [Actinomycetota bacterium]MCI0677804.1 MFS transporter [Actinomycetota bacterium]
MPPEDTSPERLIRIYLNLVFLQTLAASFIWGVNTLFLLDAGLSLTEAFLANAAFTAGMVIFEVPTGVVADSAGRKTSFVLGAVTLLFATLFYLGLWQIQADVVWWVVVSVFLGLGFTFFSGATEAWLVDALDATGYTGGTERVFGRGQSASGAAMLIGSVSGGFLAQINLGVPYLFRSATLVVVIVTAVISMHDIGFEPRRMGSVREEVKSLLTASVEQGLRNRPVRLLMLAAPFVSGIGVWIFYAFQPYMLELLGDDSLVFVAGIAAAVFALAGVAGGASVGLVSRLAPSRTAVLVAEVILSAVALIGVGLASNLAVPWGFWVAILLLTLIALVGAVAYPVQLAYINDLIPSAQRATVLSFNSLMGSAGGVVSQPLLGRVADVWSLGVGYVVAGAIKLIGLPFVLAVRRLRLPADKSRETVDLT